MILQVEASSHTFGIHPIEGAIFLLILRGRAADGESGARLGSPTATQVVADNILA